jgi:hypothetical protein
MQLLINYNAQKMSIGAEGPNINQPVIAEFFLQQLVESRKRLQNEL